MTQTQVSFSAQRGSTLYKVGLQVGLALFIVAVLRVGLEIRNSGWNLADLSVYRMGANALLDGGNVYEVASPRHHLLFTYPPFAAFVFLPMAVLWYRLVQLVGIGISATALLLSIYVCLRSVLPRWSVSFRWVATLAISAVLIFAEPVHATFTFGQINLVLLAAVLYDILPAKTRLRRGVLVGIATAIKLTPGIFILFFIVTKQTRAAITSGITFICASLLAFLLRPSLSIQYWHETIFETDRIGFLAYSFNQSLRGTIARLSGSVDSNIIVWAVGVAIILAGGLVLTAIAFRQGLLLFAVGICSVTELLISPVSWNHHYAFAVPAGIALWAHYAQYRQRLALISAYVWTIVFGFGPLNVLPFSNRRVQGVEYNQQGLEIILGNLYVITAIGLLIVAPFLMRDAQRRLAQETADNEKGADVSTSDDIKAEKVTAPQNGSTPIYVDGAGAGLLSPVRSLRS